jgi:hypothetical protein
MRASVVVKSLFFGALLATNLLMKPASANECCKFCGSGSIQGSCERWDLYDCEVLCHVTQCSSYGGKSTNCNGGEYDCTDAYNDWCDDPMPACGGDNLEEPPPPEHGATGLVHATPSLKGDIK